MSAVTAPGYDTSSVFMSTLFADQQRDGTEEFLKKMKKNKEMHVLHFPGYLLPNWLSVNEVLLPSSYIRSSATFKYTWK